jgi:dTDP-4-dehydrorhamnose reductase
MKVLILGATGMLGHKLWTILQPEFETYATVRGSDVPPALRHLAAPTSVVPNVHAENFDSVLSAFAHVRPDAVVNCIGIIKQHESAKDPIVSLTVNSLFPQRLAKLCQSRRCRLIHISTDCVFSGRKGNYLESDPSDAEDLYGRSKFLGEVEGPGCMTIRTSIIGHELHSRYGLLEWFLSQRGGKVKGFRNAIFSGLTTPALSRVIADLLSRPARLEGLWQVASEPIAKYDLLTLMRAAYHVAVEIEPETTTCCDRSLCGKRFAEATGWQAPSWANMIEDMRQDHEEWRPSLAKVA